MLKIRVFIYNSNDNNLLKIQWNRFIIYSHKYINILLLNQVIASIFFHSIFKLPYMHDLRADLQIYILINEIIIRKGKAYLLFQQSLMAVFQKVFNINFRRNVVPYRLFTNILVFPCHLKLHNIKMIKLQDKLMAVSSYAKVC